MCDRGDVVQVIANGRSVDVDRCIAGLVGTLNRAGIGTLASCCGHGCRPGIITLVDGRTLVLYSPWEATKAMAAVLDGIHDEPHSTNPSGSVQK